MYSAYLVAVWLHVLAAAAWIGGMFFLVLVFVPLMRRAEDPTALRAVFHAAALRFRTVGWICLGLLLATGLLQMSVRAGGVEALAAASFWGGRFGGMMIHKLGLFLLVVALSAVHDFWIGPAASQAARQEPGSARAERLRAASSWMGRLNMVLALVVVWTAVRLPR
jgi:putative copper resistance protein D